MSESFVWYDLETFGRDPRRTRIAQFAAIRTDAELVPIGEPEALFCRPALDLLPSPGASLVTGLSPSDLLQRGLREAECMQRIASVFAEPGSCGVGWNSLRFDDEFLRFGFYRNFIDPYRREYEHGNSRWDLLDFARLVHAIRPDGVVWPKRDDGPTSFRLEHLAAANGITHASAHDALSDVEAMLGVARLLRAAQPRLWNYHLGFRSKTRARALLEPARPTPVLHVSGRFPAERGCAGLVLPLAEHPQISNQIIVCDLRDDPEAWLGMDVEDLRERLYAPRDALPEGESRVPLKTVHLNRCPALVELGHLREPELARLGIDRERSLDHAKRLTADAGLPERVRQVFAQPHSPSGDVDQALYDGFLDSRDVRLHAQIRASAPEDLGALACRLHDRRGDELLFRYRARNWPHTLDAEDRQRWNRYRESRLAFDSGLSECSFENYEAEISAFEQVRTGPAELALLADLRAWGRHLQTYP